MAATREIAYIDSFDGGLNLTDQTQSLAENESPDCLNVDFSGRGGFVLRGGFQDQASNQLLQDARFLGHGYFGSFSGVLIQGTTNELLKWDGSTLTDTTEVLSDDADERVRMANFQDVAYFANCWDTGVLKARKWDGTTFTTMTNAFNDTYTSPSGTSGDMPLGRYIASWYGFMWLGDTVESSVRYSNRLRFSHEQAPEDWATDDWFTVGEVGDGDPITSLVPFGDRLLVFKRNSVWEVTGYDKDTWVLSQLTNASGTCTCGAIAVNSGIAYWFSTDGQLMAYNGQDRGRGAGVAVLSEPIRWWSDIGRIKHGGAHRLMWSDGRLWMSLEAGTGEDAARWLFVWDPSSKTFTRYDREVIDLVHWPKSGSDGDPIFLMQTVFLVDDEGNRLTDIDDNYLTTDCSIYRYDRQYFTDTDANGTVRIDGYYRTGWLTAGETATRKRWKRPLVTAAGKGQATIKVDVFHDFNDLSSSREFEILIDSPESASLWGVMNWGDPWYQQADEYYSFDRLGASGTARSVSYKFSSPDNTSRWWIDSVAVPFRRKQFK